MNCKRYIFLFIAIFNIVSAGVTHAQGLRFYGIDEPIAQRTGYCVFTKDNLHEFTHFLDIEFEFQISNFKTFGYILNITDRDRDSEYSLTFSYASKETCVFKFNTSGKENHISININNSKLEGNWIPLKLHIDFESAECSLQVADEVRQSSFIILTPAKLKPELTFGRKEHLSDVPAFAIRKLSVSDSNHQFSFPLNERLGEDVHDSKQRVVGRVANPYWLINESFHWKRLNSVSSKGMRTGSVFDKGAQKILLIKQDKLYTYQIDDNSITESPYSNSMPINMLLGNNYIDEANQKLFSYEINGLPYRNVTISELDLVTNKWTPAGFATTDMQLHQHNGFWDKNRNRYIIFGGFGNKRYNGNFFTYLAQNDRWVALDFSGDKIPPRFFSGMAYSHNGDQLYIYGGVGNELGDQTVGLVYYNDLYRVDLKKRTIHKCWQNDIDERKVVAKHMILSDDEQYLYAIRYAEYVKSTQLQLYRICIATSEMEMVGDSIPFISGSILSSVSLYHNAKSEEFYCVTNQFDELSDSSNVAIYRLAGTPLSQAEVDLYPTTDPVGNKMWWFIAGIVFIVGAGCAVWAIIWLKKRSGLKEPGENRVTDLPLQHVGVKHNRNTINLYGNFSVFDRSGREITHLLGTKMRNIFIYILLNSLKEGVSSISLSEIFWLEKTEGKIKNLKGVTISNLRKILSEIDGVELLYEKGFFTLRIQEPCFCDFLYMQNQIKECSEDYSCYIPIWEQGKLLENIDFEMFDKYKERSEDMLFTMLTGLLSENYKQNNFKYVLHICAILLKHDPIYEPALLYSVHSYNRLKDAENTYKVYFAFVTEHRKMMGDEYAHTLQSLLARKKILQSKE